MDEERLKAIALANQWRESVAHDQRSESKRLGTFLQDALESLGATRERDALDCGPFYAWTENAGSAWDIKVKAISGAEGREPPAEVPRPLMRSKAGPSSPDTPSRFRNGQEFRWAGQDAAEPGMRPFITGFQDIPFDIGPTRSGRHWSYFDPARYANVPQYVQDDDIEPIDG